MKTKTLLILIAFCLTGCTDPRSSNYFYSVNESITEINDPDDSLLSNEEAPIYFKIKGKIVSINDNDSSLIISDEDDTKNLMCSCETTDCIEKLKNYDPGDMIWLNGKATGTVNDFVYVISRIYE